MLKYFKKSIQIIKNKIMNCCDICYQIFKKDQMKKLICCKGKYMCNSCINKYIQPRCPFCRRSKEYNQKKKKYNRYGGICIYRCRQLENDPNKTLVLKCASNMWIYRLKYN